MQTSILTLMLALGVPGANSCNAQQQGLPRVGAPPPPAVSDNAPQSPVAQPAEVEEIEVGDMDVDDDIDTDAMEVEEVEPLEIPCQELAEFPASQGGTFVYTLRDQVPGAGHGAGAGAGHGAGHGQSIAIAPGSALVFGGSDGNQVKVYTHGRGGASNPFAAQTAPQNQDDRVRELEARVRELEAQLRARDGQREEVRTRSWGGLAGLGGLSSLDADNAAQARALAEEQRALARSRGEVNRKMARDYAEQARKQAAEMRKHAEVLRQQLLDDSGRWRIAEFPETAITLPPAPCPPNAPCAPNATCPPTPQCDPVAPCPQSEACPDVVEVPRVSIATTTPRAHVMRRSSASGGMAAAPQAARADEMREMMADMRKQMDEMRQQMQSLREELQNAPKRELH